MKVFFKTIFIFLILSACFALQAISIHAPSVHQFEASPYKVYKIKSINNLYILYAKRNDSIFEIVSRKQEQAMCANVKVGYYYNFILQSNLENKESQFYTPRSNRLLVTHSNFYGTAVPLEKRARYDLYTAKNLKGLCLIK